MTISQSLCTSFKVEILTALHNFGTTVVRAGTGADTFKIALYSSSATLGPSTTAYSATDEVANGNGYTTGGNTLAISQVPTSTNTTAWLDFSDSTWSGASFTANGALIYNSTQSNRAVAVLAFGSDKTVSSGDFTIVFPTGDSTSAIIRIA